MVKGLWGEGTLQYGSREVRQRSGVFIEHAEELLHQACLGISLPPRVSCSTSRSISPLMLLIVKTAEMSLFHTKT